MKEVLTLPQMKFLLELAIKIEMSTSEFEELLDWYDSYNELVLFLSLKRSFPQGI